MTDPAEIHRVRSATGPIVARAVVPPSKSIANRALVCAALADGESEVVGVAPGDDTAAMLDCLAELGVPVGLTSEGRAATRKLSRFVAPISAAVAIHASSHHKPVGTRTESKP